MDNGLVSVKYIGKRAQYIDGAYGTRIHWLQGESRLVPIDKAHKLLKHTDVYAPGAKNAPVAVIPTDNTEEEAAQDMRDSIANMSKEALSNYAKSSFGVKIDLRKAVGDLRSQVTSLVDQFGPL